MSQQKEDKTFKQKSTWTKVKSMTAAEWLFQELWETPKDKLNWYAILKKAKEIEKEHIINAMLHSLDEDGHTGDWKIKFVNDYYDKTFK